MEEKKTMNIPTEAELPEVLFFKSGLYGEQVRWLQKNAYAYGTGIRDGEQPMVYVNLGKLMAVLKHYGIDAMKLTDELTRETVSNESYVCGDNIEFRWSDVNRKYEIVKWFNDAPQRYCIVLAFFDVNRDEISLRHVGRRPIDLKAAEFEAFNECVIYGYGHIEAKLSKSKD